MVRPLQPITHRSLVQTKRHYYRLHRTAIGQQGHHQHKRLSAFLDAVQGRALLRAECLATRFALVAPLLLAMYRDMAFFYFSSGATDRVGAELFLRVYRDTLLVGLL